MKKSILVLVMSCNQEFYQRELEVVKKTWAKPIISGDYPNITFYAYSAMDDKMQNTLHKKLGVIDNVCDTVWVNTGDSLYDTFDKTVSALKTLEPLITRHKFDYIFKTTPSTYVNVPLLDAFVQKYADVVDETIYCGRIKSARYAIGPESFDLFADRNSILIPVKPYYNVLTQIKYRNDAYKNDKVESEAHWKDYKRTVDENAIGFIINNYLNRMGKKSYRYYQDWNMRCFDEMPEDMWHKQISIIMKTTKCRETELNDYKYVHDVIQDYYLDGGRVNLSYVKNYIMSDRSPKIFVFDEKENKAKSVSIEDYKAIKESGVFEPNDITTNKPSTGTNNNSSNTTTYFSYLDYFLIPHNHELVCEPHMTHISKTVYISDEDEYDDVIENEDELSVYDVADEQETVDEVVETKKPVIFEEETIEDNVAEDVGEPVKETLYVIKDEHNIVVENIHIPVHIDDNSDLKAAVVEEHKEEVVKESVVNDMPEETEPLKMTDDWLIKIKEIAKYTEPVIEETEEVVEESVENANEEPVVNEEVERVKEIAQAKKNSLLDRIKNLSTTFK